MAAYYVSLYRQYFPYSLEITKEGGQFWQYPPSKPVLIGYLCSLYSYESPFALSTDTYLERKKKRKPTKNPRFCTAPPQFCTLFAKREQAHGWCMSEAGFVWYSVTSQTAGSFYLITGKKKEKKADWENPVPNVKRTNCRHKTYLFCPSTRDTKNSCRPPAFTLQDRFSLFFKLKF